MKESLFLVRMRVFMMNGHHDSSTTHSPEVQPAAALVGACCRLYSTTLCWSSCCFRVHRIVIIWKCQCKQVWRIVYVFVGDVALSV